MIHKTEQQHINDVLIDYVLEILPQQEREAATRHIAACGQCRQAVIREQELGMAVKQTLIKATAKIGKRSNQRIPSPAHSPGIVNIVKHSQRRIVLAACLLILAVATFGLQSRLSQDTWLAPSPAMLSTKAMVTETPTATLLAITEESDNFLYVSPTPASHGASPFPELIVAPAAMVPPQISSITPK